MKEEERRSKEWYRSQGIPVGVGVPEGPTPEEYAEMQAETAEEEDMAKHLAANDMGSGYNQQTPSGDKARIVHFINTNTPFKSEIVNGELKITEGEIPFEMFKGFYGWMAHNASMSNLDERELLVHEKDLEIQEMEIRMAHPRSWYTPEKNADIRNAVHLSRLRLWQNKDGGERYLSAAEIQDDLKAYKVLKNKQPGKISNLANKVRGRGE